MHSVHIMRAYPCIYVCIGCQQMLKIKRHHNMNKAQPQTHTNSCRAFNDKTNAYTICIPIDALTLALKSYIKPNFCTQ